MVGSISARWREWRKAGAPRMMVQWLKSGVPLEWIRPPQPTQSTMKTPGQSSELQQELTELVKSGAFVPMETKFIALTFIIPKKGGGTRLIHDLRSINRCLAPPKFTLKGAKEAAAVVRESEWLVSLDMKHGYQQVAVSKKARKYLGAQCGDKTVASTVLPFGLNLSPYVFT